MNDDLVHIKAGVKYSSLHPSNMNVVNIYTTPRWEERSGLYVKPKFASYHVYQQRFIGCANVVHGRYTRQFFIDPRIKHVEPAMARQFGECLYIKTS